MIIRSLTLEITGSNLNLSRDNMTTITDILKDLSDKLSSLNEELMSSTEEKLNEMNKEQLKEWSDQVLNSSKKYVPVRMNRFGRMLPPEFYDRPIDRYLDETWGKDFFR